MTEPVETADPRHYFRLILSRLLETQQVLSCYKNSPPEVRAQQYFNAATLSEVKSWLEETGGDWEIVAGSRSARTVAIAGPDLRATPTRTAGSPWAILAKPAGGATASGTSLVPSSASSASGMPALVRSSNGRITFLPKSSDAKPDCT